MRQIFPFFFSERKVDNDVRQLLENAEALWRGAFKDSQKK
jgi:hypothetical protein